MKTYSIAVIAGDGAGPGVIMEGQRAIEAVADSFKLEWVSYPYSAAHYLKTGEGIPDAALGEIGSLDAVFLGPVGDKRVKGGAVEKLVLKKLRSCLGQYVEVRPVRLHPGVQSSFSGMKPEDIDFSIVRENTEDFYVGIGGSFWKCAPGEMAVQAGVISRKASERAIEYAFRHAKEKKRKLVTSCDNASTMPHSHGLWRRIFCETSNKNKKIGAETASINEVILGIASDPSHYQVIVTPNMFGDIISGISALLQGGAGMAFAVDVNPAGICSFKPMGQQVSGKQANPMGAMLAGAEMLEKLGERKASVRLKRAVLEVLREEKERTPDIGGKSGCAQVGLAIEKKLVR